ncbi:Dynamin central region-domain-containing protein [Chaetomidium leptoderma]|uniref:Dynamin central region-domain-containing protein n=1 Tax=Chaetomidium leptoderma TaxID=669021 RepID=A0AAN7A1Z6_9PEZI|nr:Dynamin central region-domain-containing protein [Chaetomidium leptoderma]
MGAVAKKEPLDGLGNHIYLEKQDKLREIGVDIPTSQQTSDRRDRLRGFRHERDDFDGKTLAGVIEVANTAMGIRSGKSKDDTSLPMFSDDILKVEISGPERPHLTVIDVPGLFQVTDQGITTDLDKAKVETMVRRYMENERNTFKLGYFIVRNRGADEDTLSIAECQMKEKAKFAETQWAELVKLGRTGVEALRAELQTLLTELARRELPKQRSEVEQRLSECRKKLEAMGAPRDNSASQRECLVRLASQFERIVRDALDGRYDGNPIFSDKPELRLATEIVDLNEGFSDVMWKKGHKWEFVTESSEDVSEGPLEYEKMANAIQASVSSIPELQHLVCANTVYPAPSDESILDHIGKYYKESRGPELGTFGGSLLAMTFRAQASKWRNIVMAHVETVIVVVHRFIKTLLNKTFGDQRMREELWGSVLLEKLQAAYVRAKDQAGFLLDIEINGRPRTFNHYFNDNVEKSRTEGLTRAIKKSARCDRPHNFIEIHPSAVVQMVTKKNNSEQTKEDIHNNLKSYYKVSRKRFVDVICRQVVDHFLLDGSGSPLNVLTSELIATMSDAQLDMIAGEDATTKREREQLRSEIQGLEAARKVLRD